VFKNASKLKRAKTTEIRTGPFSRIERAINDPIACLQDALGDCNVHARQTSPGRHPDQNIHSINFIFDPLRKEYEAQIFSNDPYLSLFMRRVLENFHVLSIDA